MVHIKNRSIQSLGAGHIVDSLGSILSYLPDVSFLANELDEPRVIGSDTSSENIKFDNMGRRNIWREVTAVCPASATLTSKPPYVESMDAANDICQHPDYENQYGFFTSPCTFVATSNLVPIFSVARISTMRDILVPGHDYRESHFLNENDTDTQTFLLKEDKLYWRGSSTATPIGTWATNDSWKTNHRVRLLLQVKNNTDFNVGMTSYIQCDNDVCDTMAKELGSPPRATHEESFNYKFVMDMDGNGYSGRYYRLLLSNSVVFKQTLVEQWHDDRLFPWVHYVPVSVGFGEIEDLLGYFARDERGKELSRMIAAESTLWTKKALRQIDMTIYEYRLLLEYARLFEERS
ncbi:hypothetical protein ABW20_dc0110249 [Dactylellina cionopaga]|nr:hypothetical protein ABW20_dc0110249 [Dactylellina cionopaga]